MLQDPKAVVFKGEKAGNGKSQVLDLIRGLLPEDAVVSIPPGKFGDERYSIKLAGKLLNATDELGTSRAIASDRFKQIVTGDPITARDVWVSAVTFRPTAQHVFATNDLPAFEGGMDRGVRRRLVVVTFNRVIPPDERVPRIGRLVAHEDADLLLDWAVRGAGRLIQQGRFTDPESSQQAIYTWLLDADPVLAWLESDEVEFDGDGPRPTETRSRDAYAAFQEWTKREGIRVPSKLDPPQVSKRVLASGHGVERLRRSDGARLVGAVRGK